MKRVIIVAHPDDEILFFSSLLNKVDKIIVCFGPSKNQTVSKGREKLQSQYPLSKVQWLNMQESDTYLSANWNNPVVTDAGLKVRRNKEEYRENFKKLVNNFESILDEYDEIYTHNPWGEYGNEEHVSVFNAVCSTIGERDTNVYVSSYVSDRSSILFNVQKQLLESNIIIGKIPRDLCVRIKDLYINTECWTWANDYEWPQSEIFIKVNTLTSQIKKQENVPTSNPPTMMFTRSFKRNILRQMVSRVLSAGLKKRIKLILKIR